MTKDDRNVAVKHAVEDGHVRRYSDTELSKTCWTRSDQIPRSCSEQNA